MLRTAALLILFILAILAGYGIGEVKGYYRWATLYSEQIESERTSSYQDGWSDGSNWRDRLNSLRSM